MLLFDLILAAVTLFACWRIIRAANAAWKYLPRENRRWGWK